MTSETAQEILFGPFCLDRPGARLLRGGRVVPLTPKAFDVLAHLASRRNRLVTKEELLSAVWPDVIVSDASVKVCVAELRKALADDPKTPRYIETAHRRGYRFIAETNGEAGPAVAVRPAVLMSDGEPASSYGLAVETRAASVGTRMPSRFVGRAPELARLEEAFARVADARRQVLFVCGAAGTGKTALVHAFLHTLGRTSVSALGGAVCCVGHCFEQFGTSEPYLPVWEALGSVPAAARVPSLHRLVQSHGLNYGLGTGHAAPGAPDPREQTDRLTRELTEAIEAQASRTPMVLVLEDLHWADYSTLNLVSALARRQGPTRLLIVGTYRPHEAAATEPLRALTYDLLPRRLCSEMRLGFLDEGGVGAYLRARFDSCEPSEALCQSLYQRTLGHPLFLVSLIDDLVEQGLLDPAAGGEDAAAHIADAAVPRTVRAMIESQFERLTVEEQRVLQGAAVAGVEFGGAAVAGALGGEADDAGGDADQVVACEAACDVLARRGRFIEPAGIVEWPDGTVANRYRFVHELYHNVVYGRVPAARCARMHRALALRLEQAWGARAREAAAELAMHCERGREWSRAVTYLRTAAERATEQYAHREAVDYLRRALAGLERLADAERPVDELTLLVSLGVHLQVTRGFAAPEVGEVHERAHAICRALNDPRRTFPVLWGIWLFKKVRSDLPEARRLAGELLAMARELEEPAFVLQAQQSVAVTSMCLGEFDAARDAMLQAEAIYDPARFDKNTQSFGQDPCVACLAFGSIALHLTGDADGSARAGQRSMELAGQLGQPSSMALALHFSAMLHQLRGDAPGAERQARRAMELAAWEEFSFWHAGGRILCAWAAAVQGRNAADSIAELRAGIDAWLATGSRTYHTYFLGLLADALLRHGRTAEALEVLEGAIDLVSVLHEGLHHAELHRLTAACLARSRREGVAESALEELETAAAIARGQGAHWVVRQVERQREELTRPAAMARGRR